MTIQGKWLWKKMVADMMLTLQEIHQCKLPYTTDYAVQEFICEHQSFDATDPDDYPSTPAERIVRFLRLGRYVVFCSSPLCDRNVSEDKSFLYCAKCKLSRYCSKSCQAYHWDNGHKKDCLDIQKSPGGDFPITRWCCESGFVCPDASHAEDYLNFCPEEIKLGTYASLLRSAQKGTLAQMRRDGVELPDADNLENKIAAFFGVTL